MHVVEGGQAREILYDDAYFDMPADSPGARAARRIPASPASASRSAASGRLDWRKNDWVAFLGASYFRAIGELYQYGLSARGLAVDTRSCRQARGIPRLHAMSTSRPPRAGSDTVTVYALLDGPERRGAYRFIDAARPRRW